MLVPTVKVIQTGGRDSTQTLQAPTKLTHLLMIYCFSRALQLLQEQKKK